MSEMMREMELRTSCTHHTKEKVVKVRGVDRFPSSRPQEGRDEVTKGPFLRELRSAAWASQCLSTDIIITSSS